MKPPLLFLCHRIPFPPNKGDKIRSFHLLHHLSRHFDIYLATFVDDPADWAYVPDLEKLCKDCLFVEQKKWPSRLRSLTGLLTGNALSIPFYDCGKMHDWVRKSVEEHNIERAMVFSSSMAQYVLDSDHRFARQVVDFVDVDSDKWQQYAQQQSWPMNWLYQREARLLLDYEVHLAHEFDAGLFVSSAEAELFRQLSPETAPKVGYYNNGVNTEYFKVSDTRENPYPVDLQPVVFTGAMDYWPNVDAVVWFAEKVLPALREAHADVVFYIVGSNPAKAVSQLARLPGVTVTGRVEDVRPYLQFAHAAVAPMRIARGVQNKVLEAMAMEKPVIVSAKGLEGIAAGHATEVLIADEPKEYVDLIGQVIHSEFSTIGSQAKDYVRQQFNWENNLPEVSLLLAPPKHEAAQHGRETHG